MRSTRALVIFSNSLSKKEENNINFFDIIVAPKALKENLKNIQTNYVELESLIEPESVSKASEFAEELSKVIHLDNRPIAKTHVHHGYELWWIHYDQLFTNACLPFTRYEKLLKYLSGYSEVYSYDAPHNILFSCYLSAFGCTYESYKKNKFKGLHKIPFGTTLQIILTLLSLPLLMVYRPRIGVFTSDLFDGKDPWDPRMRFIYSELKSRQLRSIEFIRSLEPWRTMLRHAFIRRRPVIYLEAIHLAVRFFGFIVGLDLHARKKFIDPIYRAKLDYQERFKLLLASQSLLGIYDDINSICILKIITRMIGIRALIIPGASSRNFHLLIAAKMNNIPTVGVLHGAASQYYNVYEFMPGYNSAQSISIDRYGLWSEWWKEYFIKHSRIYTPDQLYIAGLMRPLTIQTKNIEKEEKDKKNRVLFISEIVAIPEEVVPYLDALLQTSDFKVIIKFRSSNDIFESWLKKHRPDIIASLGETGVLKGSIHEAIANSDIVVGCQSTAVIEAVLQAKPFVFFKTHKWGDYFGVKNIASSYNFFAENEEELILYIREGLLVPKPILLDIQKKFFGDPYQNGSKWVVDQIEEILHQRT